MYCGDETGSFIGEVGSHVSRFGYGGNDCPTHVVPSYVAQLDNNHDNNDNNNNANNNNKKKKRIIPTSCYNRRLAQSCELKSALRMAAATTDSSSSSSFTPITNPDLYLGQGDSIEHWDVYEQLWQNAYDTLRVHDTSKHTMGGNNKTSTTTTTTTAASGVQSSTISSSSTDGINNNNNNNNNNSQFAHPVLAVTPGCTYRMGTTGQSSSQYNSHHHRNELIQMTELFMETFQTQALFIAPSPMLTAFSHGRQTALIVDIGAKGTVVTPIVDGLVLKQAQRRNGRGGDWLGNVQWHAMIKEPIIVRPRYQIEHHHHHHFFTTNTTGIGTSSSSSSSTFHTAMAKSALFHRWAMQDLMYEFRTSEYVKLPTTGYNNNNNKNKGPDDDSEDDEYKIPFAKRDDNEEEEEEEEEEEGAKSDEEQDKKENAMEVEESSSSSSSSSPGQNTPVTTTFYELPDGTLVDLTTDFGKDLCRVPELLFTDELPFVDSNYYYHQSSSSFAHPTLSNLPIHKLIHASLSAVGDVDLRKDLANNIVLSGGSSVLGMPHLEERLSYELAGILSSAFKSKVIASKFSVERSCASWIGGSILTSLGSFQQLWLSKTEYEEYGAALAVQRFPG